MQKVHCIITIIIKIRAEVWNYCTCIPSSVRVKELLVVQRTLQLKMGANGRMSRAVTNVVWQIETTLACNTSQCYYQYHRYLHTVLNASSSIEYHYKQGDVLLHWSIVLLATSDAVLYSTFSSRGVVFTHNVPQFRIWSVHSIMPVVMQGLEAHCKMTLLGTPKVSTQGVWSTTKVVSRSLIQGERKLERLLSGGWGSPPLSALCLVRHQYRVTGAWQSWQKNRQCSHSKRL